MTPIPIFDPDPGSPSLKGFNFVACFRCTSTNLTIEVLFRFTYFIGSGYSVLLTTESRILLNVLRHRLNKLVNQLNRIPSTSEGTSDPAWPTMSAVGLRCSLSGNPVPGWGSSDLAGTVVKTHANQSSESDLVFADAWAALPDVILCLRLSLGMGSATGGRRAWLVVLKSSFAQALYMGSALAQRPFLHLVISELQR